ncbi:MAG: hypothetical protein K1000chlam2_00473 [Chlamydiae bacterium]|nr:hypothetical protein [Chlamydiota bacterium]
MEETLDQLSAMLPIDFFSMSLDLKKAPLGKRHLLPDFSELLFENSFAKVFMGWSEKGLAFEMVVDKAFEEEDRIELFIDTRDLKSAGFLTKFCHHFMIEGTSAREVTAFRTEDRHELCDPEKIEVKGDFRTARYTLNILIPSECLHGYDPKAFDRLGFSYRINRVGGDPQHFTLSSDYLMIEKQPSLWSSLQMRDA